MFEIDLIDAVRRYPCIYDTNMDRTALIVKMAWKAVAGEVGEDVQVCRSRWRSLRDRYVKELRITDPHYVSVWSFKEKMDFLKDFLSVKPASREGIDPQNENSCNTMGIEEEQKQEQIVCTADEGTNQDMNSFFEDVYIAQGIDEQKEEYFDQTPAENVNNIISCNTFDYEEENKDCVKEETTQKRTLKDSHEDSDKLTNPRKKKRKLFLSDLIDPQINDSLLKQSQHTKNSRTNYDTLIGTLNEYIRNRVGQEQNENEDFFKVLDTYLMKLPENVQDELMAKILLKVINKSNEK